MKIISQMVLAFAMFVAGVFAVNMVQPLKSQPSAPAAINGCVYLSSTITLTNLQQQPFLCDINGRLKVTTTP